VHRGEPRPPKDGFDAALTVFVPVAIERRSASGASLTVEDPVSGLRVINVDVDTAVELFRRMR
jgi:hypothetical protein